MTAETSTSADTHLDRMEEIMRAACADSECELTKFNGENNHVHLLVKFPPNTALSKLVNSLTGTSSHSFREEYPELVRPYWQAQPLSSGSHFAVSAGAAPLSAVRQYIERPNRALQPARQSTSQNQLTAGPKPSALRPIPVALVGLKRRDTHALYRVRQQLRQRFAG
ncbi:IS200/IS605 family transposase [Streptomyces sp. NBC_01724]|nr:IS200/IS605 family transposase [Streptomyces sp. NBC_01724]WTE52080.1 IS200/IS605 family transposase [Streptomyces sp. NBC_01620]